MNSGSRIYVAGHLGLVGSALLRKLKQAGYLNLITRTHSELDLTDQKAVGDFFKQEKPDYVFMAAAKVGGIRANSRFPVELLHENLSIQNNVISAAYSHQVSKLLFLGSSCIYPKHSAQPIKESTLLTGSLEPTNEPYAIAKIAGLKLCEAYNQQYATNYITLMPCNLYGPGDSFDLENSHVLPALIFKIVLAKLLSDQDQQNAMKLAGYSDPVEFQKFLDHHAISHDHITLWGTGQPRREFLHSDDLAAACIFAMEHYHVKTLTPAWMNVGSGVETTIQELASLVKDLVGFEGDINFDPNYPDGTYRKLLDTTKINALGWRPTISLESGIQDVITRQFSPYLTNS